MGRIEMPELIGNMHTNQIKNEGRDKPNYIEQNNILIVEITALVDEAFISEVCRNKSAETNVAIVEIENSNENALFHATALIELLKETDMCVICICKDKEEVDENGNRKNVSLELQLRELKDKVDLLIITQDKHDYQDVIHMLLTCDQTSRGVESCTISEILYDRFRNAGFAYYNCIYAEEEWNSRTLMNFAMFDSMFICPIYKAKDVFLQIEAGDEFQISENNELNDEGIILGDLEDHLQENCNLNSWWDIYETMSPFAIKLQFLFWNFDKSVFVFDEKYTWQYPKAENKSLEKRIERLMQNSVLYKL